MRSSVLFNPHYQYDLVRILEYVRSHPGCTRAEISVGLGYEVHHSAMRELHALGKIRSVGKRRNSNLWRVK